jgi:hypothetical protein
MFGVQRLLSVRYHRADLRRGEESIIFFWSAGMPVRRLTDQSKKEGTKKLMREQSRKGKQPS